MEEKTKKPKRKVADIRAEKLYLSGELYSAICELQDLAKKTPFEFLKNASYQQVLDFKDLIAKTKDYFVNGSGSAKVLNKKIQKVNGFIYDLKRYHQLDN